MGKVKTPPLRELSDEEKEKVSEIGFEQAIVNLFYDHNCILHEILKQLEEMNGIKEIEEN